LASATTPNPSKPATVDEDIAEFVMLFWPTIRRMKSAVPPPTGLREVLEGAGLGPRHVSSLLTVALTGPLSVTELSERLGLQLSTTSTMVGELSRAGLLDRVEDDQDRRRTIVHLPREYADELPTWLESTFSPVRATLERLSLQARKHFMEGWRVLAEESDRAGSGEETLGCPQ
jgi:DNA-binding MarR family transcriptional regulator